MMAMETTGEGLMNPRALTLTAVSPESRAEHTQAIKRTVNEACQAAKP